MDAEEIRRRMLERFEIRVEPHMSQYMARRMAEVPGASTSMPIIGGDAKTGVPVRTSIDPRELLPPSA